MAFDLLQAVLDNGIDTTHYFNGRILTADALRDDQKAHRRQRQQLGRAIGAGIVHGLSVRLLAGSDPPALRVTAGLALNGQGQALELAQNVDVTLAATDPEAAAGGLFAACQPTDTGEYVTGRNVYVLALAPASGYREKAPMYDLGPNGNGRADGCGFRYAVEGVQFRLVEIDLDDEEVISGAAQTDVEELINAEPQDAATVSKLRNLLAHLCLGTVDAADFPADAFSYLAHGATPPTYGLLSGLTNPDPAQADEHTLTPCDVPLALLYWTTAGVQFVDMWAVRRRVIRPEARLSGLPLVSDRRLAEGEAAFWQFQAQVAEMQKDPTENLVSITATDRFRYLPSVGIIPLASNRSSNGFHLDLFFDPVVHHPVVRIEGARLGAMVRTALTYPSHDLGSSVTMWVYRVRENERASATRTLASPPQPFAIFASGHMAYMGDPHFDVNRWEFGNWAYY